jgi:hypothetical protein
MLRSVSRPVQSAYPAGPTAMLHRPDPIMIVAEPSFVVELAYIKLPFWRSNQLRQPAGRPANSSASGCLGFATCRGCPVTEVLRTRFARCEPFRLSKAVLKAGQKSGLLNASQRARCGKVSVRTNLAGVYHETERCHHA